VRVLLRKGMLYYLVPLLPLLLLLVSLLVQIQALVKERANMMHVCVGDVFDEVEWVMSSS